MLEFTLLPPAESSGSPLPFLAATIDRIREERQQESLEAIGLYQEFLSARDRGEWVPDFMLHDIRRHAKTAIQQFRLAQIVSLQTYHEPQERLCLVDEIENTAEAQDLCWKALTEYHAYLVTLPCRIQPRIMTKKRCPECRTFKTVEEFGKCRANTDGYQAYCKPCIQNRQAAKRQERIKAGNCARCGKVPPAEGIKLCLTCRDKVNGYRTKMKEAICG